MEINNELFMQNSEGKFISIGYIIDFSIHHDRSLNSIIQNDGVKAIIEGRFIGTKGLTSIYAEKKTEKTDITEELELETTTIVWSRDW